MARPSAAATCRTRSSNANGGKPADASATKVAWPNPFQAVRSSAASAATIAGEISSLKSDITRLPDRRRFGVSSLVGLQHLVHPRWAVVVHDGEQCGAHVAVLLGFQDAVDRGGVGEEDDVGVSA